MVNFLTTFDIYIIITTVKERAMKALIEIAS